MVDKKDLDIKSLRKSILEGDPHKGGLAPGTAVSEISIDSVTGLLPRVIWQAEMQQHLDYAKRNEKSFAIAMMDIDAFKKINDRLGHSAGDRVLRRFGQAIIKRFREADITGRYGGDEAIVMLTDFDLDESELEKEEDELSKYLLGKVDTGISVGIAKWDGMESLEEVIVRADKRLYYNKNNKNG